jgi:hypothetical protein
MRQTNAKATNFSMLLICEGTHTEPNFFGAMIDWLKEDGKIDFKVQILPKPTITSDDDELDLNRGAGGRKKRTLNNDTQQQQEVEKTNPFPGEQPLNWVRFGIEQLHIYNEVWAVFDKDGHPKTAEAFNLSENTQIEGKKLKIAFSSRCFEYYLLLHFELIYKAFEKSECNGKTYFDNGRKSKTVSYHCMTPRAVKGKACQGDSCINGYARLKEYWQDSKGNNSTFTLIADKLWVGICNAHAIRWQSNMAIPDVPFYIRNPYVDVDKLTCRLMGYETIEHKETRHACNGKDSCFIRREKDMIMFTLESDRTIIIPSGNIIVHNNLTNKSREAGIRLLLTADQTEQQLDLCSIMNENEYCVITILSKPYFCTLLP